MNKDCNIPIIKTLFTGLSNRLLISHSALDQIRLNESLSPAGLQNIRTIDLCYHHMNHLCRFIDYLTSEQDKPDSADSCYFDVEDLLCGITEAFNVTVSDYLPVTASWVSKLKSPQTLCVNKTKFETVFLNVLYSCLKTIDSFEYSKTKLTLSVSETKRNIIFHIHTNTLSSASEKVSEWFASPHYFTPDIYSQDTVLALSLDVASMFVREMGGVMACKTLKSGNRYDILMAKTHVADNSTKLRSPSAYFPTYEHFEETFAEFKLLSFQ